MASNAQQPVLVRLCPYLNNVLCVRRLGVWVVLLYHHVHSVCLVITWYLINVWVYVLQAQPLWYPVVLTTVLLVWVDVLYVVVVVMYVMYVRWGSLVIIMASVHIIIVMYVHQEHTCISCLHLYVMHAMAHVYSVGVAVPLNVYHVQQVIPSVMVIVYHNAHPHNSTIQLLLCARHACPLVRLVYLRWSVLRV